MSQTNINILPEEMMMRIFELLPPQDLKNAVLVSKQWKERGEDPRLRTETKATVFNREDFKKFRSRRFQWVQQIVVKKCTLIWYNYHEVQCRQCYWEEKELTELLKIIVSLPSVIKIDNLRCTKLSGVDPNLLARVLTRLEELDLCHCHRYLSAVQIQHIFVAIAEQTNLKKLEVSETSQISPALFAAAISNVEEVMVFIFGESSPEQMVALFAAIAEEERPLRKLLLDSCDVREVLPEVFGVALNRLEDVETVNMSVNKEQITAVLSRVVGRTSKLKKLMLEDLSNMEYSSLDRRLVRRAWTKIGEFYTNDDSSDDVRPVRRPVFESSEDEETWDDYYEEELFRLFDDQE